MSRTEFVFESEEEAQRACWWWQKVLRLADWDIKCWIRRQYDLNPHVDGEYRLSLEHKQGWIKLIDQTDYNPDTAWSLDHEIILVHELMHYHVTPFEAEENTSARIAQEQMIELTAEALVSLRRQAFQNAPWRVKDERE